MLEEGSLLAALKGNTTQEDTTGSRGSVRAKTALGYLGLAFGLVGSWGMKEMCEGVVNVMLRSVGIQGAEVVGRVCGYVGGVAFASFRGFATKKFFEGDLYNILTCCCSQSDTASRPWNFAKKVLSSALTLIGTTATTQIALDTHIKPPYFNWSVITGNVIGAFSASFWGYDSLLQGSKKEDSKANVIRNLTNIKGRLKYLKRDIVLKMYDVLKEKDRRDTKG